MARVETALGKGETDRVGREAYILISEDSNLTSTIHNVVSVNYLLFLWWCRLVQPRDR